MKQYWYHAHFKVQRVDGGSEHTRTICMNVPIEYASDVDAASEICAQMVDAKKALLMHWIPLLGPTRPDTA